MHKQYWIMATRLGFYLFNADICISNTISLLIKQISVIFEITDIFKWNADICNWNRDTSNWNADIGIDFQS